MSERVRVTVDEAGVADVRLARPDKHNALDVAMFDALVEAGEGLKNRPELRCVVLSGEGASFCAGLDLSSFMALGAGGELLDRFLERREGNPANHAQRIAWIWRELPVPVIAAVHGVAYGGGLQIALAADLRILSPDAKMSVMEMKWGLIPDLTATQTLRHLVRLDVAKELLFTGRIVEAEEAVTLGLATRIAPDPRAAAFDLAQQIASKSPDAIRFAKRLLDETVQLDEAAGLALETELQFTLLGKANQLEAVAANFQKRPPKFADPES